MISTFPPSPKHGREVDIAVAVVASFMPEATATYISAPITSGKRFMQWRNSSLRAKDLDYEAELNSNVIEPNRRHIKDIVHTIRANVGGIVVDPTALDNIAGWTQSDYHVLWASIIKKYAHQLVLVDDWHYSNGCCYEFLVATQLGLPRFTERMEPLSTCAGIELINESRHELMLAKVDTSFLSTIRDILYATSTNDTQIVALKNDFTERF